MSPLRGKLSEALLVKRHLLNMVNFAGLVMVVRPTKLLEDGEKETTTTRHSLFNSIPVAFWLDTLLGLVGSRFSCLTLSCSVCVGYLVYVVVSCRVVSGVWMMMTVGREQSWCVVLIGIKKWKSLPRSNNFFHWCDDDDLASHMSVDYQDCERIALPFLLSLTVSLWWWRKHLHHDSSCQEAMVVILVSWKSHEGRESEKMECKAVEQIV